MEPCQILVFRLGDVKLAVECDTVMAVHPPSQVVFTEIENAPEHILGMIFAGEIRIPVISLYDKLGILPHNDGVNIKVIVVQDGDNLFGIIADQVTGVTSSLIKELEAEQMFPVDTRFICSLASEGDCQLPVLDWPALFDFEEAIKAIND